MSSPPRTHNALSAAERARLVRSTRKLQALLGETPQVIAAAVSTTRTPAPDAESPIHGLYASQSLSRRRPAPPTALTLAPGGPDSTRPRLHLHLEAPRTPTSARHSLSSLSLPATPLSPTASITLNSPGPAAPARSPSTSKDARRRRLAKVARTLGENVAPELVGAPTPDCALAPAIERTGSLRTAKSAAALREPASPPPSASRPLKAPSLGRSFSTSTRRPALAVAAVPHRRAESVVVAFPGERGAAFPSDHRDAHTGVKAHTHTGVKAADLAHALARLDAELRAGKRRKEKEWSGEWNMEMKAVAKQLRGLRAEP
ncbi:hypothetical protein FB451DRAFT_1521174 [Mycena latifolia]|nr:hypothetical protein FB451DRAFT_1521174 [Mycena latifolia]